MVGGEGGERKCGSQHFSKDRQMEKLMGRKMKKTVWVLSKGKERERERWEKERVDISLPLSSKGMI